MVVKCPNCECPNDADQPQCRQCGARIPLAMREKAMVPRAQAAPAPTRNYANDDVVDRRGGRGDVHSMRAGIVPQQGHISAYSQSQYAAPTQNTAARTADGRQYLDQSQQQVQYAQGVAPTPTYADRAAWEAHQRMQQGAVQQGQFNHPSAAQTAQSLAASGQADPMAAAGMAARPGMPAPPSRRMPVPPAAGRPAGSPSHAQLPALQRPMSGESTIHDPEAPPPPKKPAPVKSPATLVFLDEEGKRREELPLRAGKTIIGRTEGELLLTHDPYVSPWHAQLTVRRTDMSIKDMFTLNGIYKRIDRQALLQDGDKFLIGRQVVQFRHGWPQAEANSQGTRPLGGPNPATAARVLVLTESGEVADLRLIRETLTIGRSGCDVSLPEDAALGDKHVQIQRDRDHFLLIDLNSQDGVYLAIRGETALKDGDTIQIGRQRMMIEREAE